MHTPAKEDARLEDSINQLRNLLELSIAVVRREDETHVRLLRQKTNK